MNRKLYIVILLAMTFTFSISAFAQQSQEDGQSKIQANGDYSGKFEIGMRCIIKQRPLDHIKLNRPLKSSADCSLSRTAIRNEYWPVQTYTIPIVFHIIYKSDGTGNISDQRVRDQVSVLNQDYGAKIGTLGENGFNTKIQFKLAGITRTVNNNWFNDQDERGFKQALGWEQSRYLNVYTNSAGGYLGYAYLPQEDAGDVYDGVVVLYEAVGGRNNGFDIYNQGRTLVHEVGHYLGLLHTFEGYGCFEGYTSGDLIADTHSENDEHYDCRQTSTCGTPDDIHNYMNYTPDSCMYEFTPEQANRIICSVVNYRPLIYQVSSTETQPGLTVSAPNGGEHLTAGTTYTIKWTSTGTVGNVKIEYTSDNGSKWFVITASTSNDGAYGWQVPDIASSKCKVRIKEAADSSPSDTSDAVFTIAKSTSPGTARISLNRTTLNFSGANSGVVTGAQQLWLNNSGDGTLNWNVNVDQWWLKCTPGSGTNSGVLTVSVTPGNLNPGNYTGTITITSPQAVNSPQTVTVYLRMMHSSQDRAPFGHFSTPLDGSTVRSSIPVTGWVLDDIGVKSVEIYRQVRNNSSFIGEAILVEGARPDVEATFPDYPKNHMAGWGYMMLTNVLPDGYHVIYAVAADNTGKRVTLGSSTIYIDNARAVKPFGTIDAPAPGGSAAGRKFRNQGWALTPRPNKIPVDGSTISVYVDGKLLGHPTYNIYRSDIAAIFPGYTNSNGAMAYLEFDTTPFDNGVHSIQWVVKDNKGNTDGIGSRYFTVQNIGTREQASVSGSTEIRPFPGPPVVSLDRSKSFRFKKGYNPQIKPQDIFPDASGNMSIEIDELELLEVYFPNEPAQLNPIEATTPLPIGSTLDRENGILYWQAGLGYLGRYELGFAWQDNAGKISKINLVVTILPRK